VQASSAPELNAALSRAAAKTISLVFFTVTVCHNPPAMPTLSDPFEALLRRRAGGPHETLLALLRDGQLYGLEVTEVEGRRVRLRDGRWLTDFASCNYLGFDLDPEVADSIPSAVARFGTHPSWARLAASPSLYRELEGELAELVGAEDTVVLPTISLIAVGLIPALVGPKGCLFVDRLAHKVNHDGCRIARDHGAKLVSFSSAKSGSLEEALDTHRDTAEKLVVIDGVLSVSGKTQPIDSVVQLGARYGALVYIDDAHGFGVLGEKPDPGHPYGYRGNGVVRHVGAGYDNVVYVAGLSKAYSSLAAFFTAPRALRSYLEVSVTGYVFSGPCQIASLATALTGLRVNARDGDARRAHIHTLSHALGKGLAALSFETDDNGFFPIQSLYVRDPEVVIRCGRFLFERGFLATMQAYPVVPRDRGVLRFTLTYANTESEVASLLSALADMRGLLS
jgi:8-amino-7-oxononanoate synthase